MQQPPNPYPQFPQQWQPLSQPQPPQQQWQPQTDYGQPQSYYPPPQQPPFSQQQYPQQQWYQPVYTQPPTYDSPQQPPVQRPKRNRVVLWVSGGIICVVLAVLIVIGSVLIGYRFFTSTQYPTLHTEYSGTIFDPTVTYNGSPITVPMALIVTSNDNQGHISGRVGMLAAPNGGDPLIGTLGVDRTITFTATPLLIGVFTVFTGTINSDGSISGATSNIYRPETWKLFPVKGK